MYGNGGGEGSGLLGRGGGGGEGSGKNGTGGSGGEGSGENGTGGGGGEGCGETDRGGGGGEGSGETCVRRRPPPSLVMVMAESKPSAFCKSGKKRAIEGRL